MNAAFFYGPNNIKVLDVPLPLEKKSYKDHFVMKVLSCSVCSYDVRTFRYGSFKVKPPVILGHEICAETLDSFESNGHSIGAKTRASIYPVIPCFECWYCKNNKFNLCSNIKEIGSTVDGGFAEYILIPKKIFEIGGVIPVTNNVTNEEASLIEPLACCINAVNQIRKDNFDSIVIIGDGPIALMQLMLFRKYYPDKQIIVIGKIKHRLEKAKNLGANTVFRFKENINYQSNNLNDLKELQISKKTPNLIFISNNNPVSLNMAFDLVNKNGKIVIFSGIKNILSTSSHNSDTNKISAAAIDPNFIHYNQISVSGSFSSNPSDLAEAMKLVDRKEITLRDLITNTFSLQNIENAFKTSEEFKGIKSVINKFDNS